MCSELLKFGFVDVFTTQKGSITSEVEKLKHVNQKHKEQIERQIENQLRKRDPRAVTSQTGEGMNSHKDLRFKEPVAKPSQNAEEDKKKFLEILAKRKQLKA